jgi:hypothetical protein
VVGTCNVRCGGDEGGTLYAWAYNGARVSTRHETPPSRNHAPEGDMGVGDRLSKALFGRGVPWSIWGCFLKSIGWIHFHHPIHSPHPILPTPEYTTPIPVIWHTRINLAEFRDRIWTQIVHANHRLQHYVHQLHSKNKICCSNHSTSLKSKNAHRNRANDDKYYIS